MYRIAQVCINGHSINPSADKYQEFNKAFCDQCGAKSITACPSCSASIKGRYDGGGIDFTTYHPPLFCDSCGKPYPWTSQAKEAAFELIQFSDILNDQDKGDLQVSINSLIEGGPKTPLAIFKFKSYATKAGKEIASGLKDILVDVVSETIKKAIWP